MKIYIISSSDLLQCLYYTKDNGKGGYEDPEILNEEEE